MDASSFQKFLRLPASFALVAILFLAGCASSLKNEKQLVSGPQDLTQKIENSSQENIQKILDSSAQATAQSASASSGKAKGKKAKAAPAPKAKATPVGWQPASWPFGIGEKLVYAMRYGPIEGGVATIEVKEPKIVDGEPVLHYHAKVRSSKVLEFFYKVDDTMDTWVGAADHLPRRQEIQQLESARWGRRVVVFDQKAQAARYYSHLTKKNGEVQEIRRDDPLINAPQDVFGALFFYRFAEDLRTLNFPVHDRFKHWNNELIFIAKEQVTVPAGTFDTIKFKMNPRITGDLNPKGDVYIWFRDDPSKVMVKFSAKIRVGSVTGELREYKAGQTPTLSPPRLVTPMRLSQLGTLL
jgi:hypothetical protein